MTDMTLVGFIEYQNNTWIYIFNSQVRVFLLRETKMSQKNFLVVINQDYSRQILHIYTRKYYSSYLFEMPRMKIVHDFFIIVL